MIKDPTSVSLVNTKDPTKNYSIEKWFSSPVYSGNAIQFTDELLKTSLKYLYSNESNKNRFYLGKTTYDTQVNLAKKKEYSKFLNYIKQQAEIFVSELGFDYKELSKQFNPFMFATELNQGSFQERHVHNAKISGILYLKVPPNSAPIQFHDPVQVREFAPWPVKDYTNKHTHIIIEYKPKVGSLLMWPSWFYHQVPAHPAIENRIGLVFNL